MRSSSLKFAFCAALTIVVATIGVTACDPGASAPGVIVPDTIYVDHGRESLITVRGKALLTRLCIERAHSAGIEVRISELNRSSFTDSAGNFIFVNIPKRELTYGFSKPGFYELSTVLAPIFTDTGYILPRVRMGTLNDWSGRFEGDTSSRGQSIVFQIVALDENDEPANGDAWLLVSDQQTIDTRDTATYLLAVPWEPRDWGLEGAYLSLDQLETIGIKAGQEYYVTPTSIALCASGFGSRHGEVRRFVRP